MNIRNYLITTTESGTINIANMQKEIDKLNEIKFATVSEFSLEWLEKKVKNELEKRRKPPTEEEHFELVVIDDGCEGFNCFIEKFSKIKPKEFLSQIILTLNQGSDIRISKMIIEKKDYYDSNMHHYNWFEENQKKPKKYNNEDDE